MYHGTRVQVAKKQCLALIITVLVILGSSLAFTRWVDVNYDCTKQHTSKWCANFVYPTEQEP